MLWSSRPASIVLTCLLGGVGCSSRPVLPGQDGGGSDGAEASSSSSGGPSTTSGLDGGTGSSSFGGGVTGTTDPALPTDTDDDSCMFLCPPDGGGPTGDGCVVGSDDCPADYKCVWWAPEFGGSRRDDARCVPVTGTGQPYDPCTLAEDYSDDCGPESYCLEVYGTSTEGFCAPFLGEDWSCDEYPGADAAVENGSDFPAACLYFECQPLLEDSCPEGMRCTFYPAWLYGGMHCWNVPAEVDLPVGTPCDFGQCGEGKLCAPAEWLPECAGDRCCADWCDLDAPGCGVPGTLCEPFPVWNYQGDPGFESLGACLLPGALR